MALRDTQDIGGGHGAHPFAIVVEIVGRQTEDLDVGESTRDFGRRLKTNREDANEIIGGERQFRIGHRRFANAIELDLNLFQRVGRDGCFHRR